MLPLNTKVKFETPAIKVGTIVSHIPAHVSRNAAVLAFLDHNPIDYEIRMGSLHTLNEDSYLIVVDGPCSKCRKRLYHIPQGMIHDTALL